jgi:hypothetical protein
MWRMKKTMVVKRKKMRMRRKRNARPLDKCRVSL